MAASVLPEPLKTAVKLPGKIASLPTDTVANLIPGGKKKIKEENIDELKVFGKPIFGKKGEALIYNDPKGRRDALTPSQKDHTIFKPGVDIPGIDNKNKVDITKGTVEGPIADTIKNLPKTAVKGGVIGATALTGAALAKRLMKKSDKKESFSNWREEVGYEGKDDSKKLQEDDMKGMSVKSGHKRPTKSGAGMTQKGVEAYRRRNPGAKLKTAVTTKPSKLKKGSKAANRRKSYCARSAGQMKKFPKAAKDPNSRLRQARRRWNC